jgi:hypothetical protein
MFIYDIAAAPAQFGVWAAEMSLKHDAMKVYDGME